MSKFIKRLATFQHYKPLLSQLVMKDIKLKYRRSFLGYVWSILNPLMIMGIMVLVFSNMFRFDIQSYPVYLIVGQTIFNFVSESTNQAMWSITGNAALLKKTYVPKYIFTFAKITSGLVDLLFSMGALLLVMIATGASFSWHFLLFPFVLLQLYMFCLGLGLFLAQANVFFRDIQYIYHAVTTAWLYLTPIFYPLDQLSPKLTWMIKHFNPMYFYIGQFRDVVYYHQIPGPKIFTAGCIAAVVMMLIGTGTFFKNQDKFILYI